MPFHLLHRWKWNRIILWILFWIWSEKGRDLHRKWAKCWLFAWITSEYQTRYMYKFIIKNTSNQNTNIELNNEKSNNSNNKTTLLPLLGNVGRQHWKLISALMVSNIYEIVCQSIFSAIESAQMCTLELQTQPQCSSIQSRPWKTMWRTCWGY